MRIRTGLMLTQMNYVADVLEERFLPEPLIENMFPDPRRDRDRPLWLHISSMGQFRIEERGTGLQRRA